MFVTGGLLTEQTVLEDEVYPGTGKFMVLVPPWPICECCCRKFVWICVIMTCVCNCEGNPRYILVFIDNEGRLNRLMHRVYILIILLRFFYDSIINCS